MKNIRLFRDKEAYKAIAPYLSYPHLSLVKDKDGTGQIKYEFEEKLTATYRVTKEMIKAYPDGVPLTTNATRLIKSVKIKGVETVFEKPEVTEGEGWKEIEWEMQDVTLGSNTTSLFLPKPGEHLIDFFKFIREKKKEDLLAVTWKLERPLVESDWFLLSAAYNALEGRWYSGGSLEVPALEIVINGLGSAKVILYDESELTLKFHPEFVDALFQMAEESPGADFPEVGEQLITFAICDGTWYNSEGQVSPEVKSYFKGDALVYTGGAPSEIKLPADSAPGIYRVEYKFWEDVEEINGEELNSDALVSLDFNIKRDWKLNSYAFAMCENLEKVNLGNRIKYVGDYAFAGCPEIKEITLPSSIEGLGNNIFLDGLKGHLIVECNCLRSNKRSFKITNLDLFISIFESESPDFSKLGDCARIDSPFANSEITEIILGEGIEFTGAYTFMNLKNLKKINFNTTTLTHIDVGAFWGSVNLLEEITIPDSVISIDGYAFFSYKGAESYLRRIIDSGGTDFSGSSITPKTITLGRGLKYLGRDSFLGNPGKLIVKSDIEINKIFNPLLSLIFAIGGIEEAILPLFLSNFDIITDVIFEDGVKKIPDLMFFSHLNLEIPVALKNCTLPDSLEELGFGAFLGAFRLSKLDLPENLKRIQSYALPPSLSQLSLGNNLEYLSSEQFLPNLSNININEETGVISLDGWILDVFSPESYISETDSIIELTLPNDCEKIPAGLIEYIYSSYLNSTTEGEGEFFQKRLKDLIVNIPDNIIIFNGVTGSCLEKEYNNFGIIDGFNNKNLPHTIKFNVGENHSHFKTENDGRFLINIDTETLINGSFDVFSEDSSDIVINIQEINIPDGIKHIESYAFSSYCNDELFYNRSLIWRLATLISIPDSVESIGEYAFSGISFLDLRLPEKITVLREGTFYYDQTLLDTIDLMVGDNKKEVALPKNLVKLENFSLSIDRIQNQIIPETIKYVGFISPGLKQGELESEMLGPSLIKKNQLETVTILGGKEYLFSLQQETVGLVNCYTILSRSRGGYSPTYHIKLDDHYCSIPSILWFLFNSGGGSGSNIYINKTHDYFLEGDFKGILYFSSSDRKRIKDNYTILECLDIEIPGAVNNILPESLSINTSFSSPDLIYDALAETLGSYSFQWAAKLRVADPITGEERPEPIYERFSETMSFDMNLTDEPIAHEIKLEHSGFEKTFIYNQPSLFSESGISREEAFSEYIKAIVDFKEDDDRKITFSSLGFIKIDDGEIFSTGTVTPYTHEFEPGVHEIYFYRGLGSEGQNKNEILFEKIIVPEGFYNIDLNGSCNILEILGSSEHTIHNDKITEIKEIHVESLEAWCNISLVEPLNSGCKVFIGSEELTSMNSIIIPSGVTHLKQNAFSGFSSITSLTLPNTIVSIDASAFSGCSNLSEIIVPDDFAYAWNGHFDETSWYINQSEEPIVYLGKNFYKIHKELISGNIVFSDKITSIPSSQFENCTELVSIEIPSSVKSIGSSAFDGCTGLTSITLNEGLEEIQDYSFRNTGISEITIPSSVKSIGLSAFRGCTGLTSIILNEGLEEILGYSFENTGISEITIPSSVKYFPLSNVQETPWYTSQPNGFLYLGTRLIGLKGSSSSTTSIRENTTHIDRYPTTSVTSITIPDSVISIGNDAFRFCRSLTSINISENSMLTSIGNYAFAYCESLTSITIPDSVVSIGNNAFSSCDNFSSFNISKNSQLTSIGDQAFLYCGNLTSITIPDSVISIGNDAFLYCYSLAAVHISSIEAWCKITFKGPWNSNPLSYARNLYLNGELITNLVIPEGVTSIKDDAFYYCSSLTSVTLPKSVMSIGDRAFYGCGNLTTINIPESVTSIGDRAFSYCNSLTSVHIKDIASWCNINFNNNTANPLYYGNLYLNGELVTELTIPNTVTAIKDNAFLGCSSLTSINIPESVKSIGNRAFYNCGNLASITIPESVTWIGDYTIESISTINLLSTELDYFGTNTFKHGSSIMIGPKCKAIEKIIKSFSENEIAGASRRDFRFIIDEQNPTYYYVGEGDIALVNRDTNSIIYWNNFEGDFYVPEEITTVNLNCGKFSDIQQINRSIYFSKNIRRVLLPQGYYSSANVWNMTDLHFNDIIFVPFIDNSQSSSYVGYTYIPEELYPIFTKLGFYGLKLI